MTTSKQVNNARVAAALLISIITSSCSNHNNSIILHPVIAFNFGEQQQQLFPRQRQHQIRQSLLYSTVKNNEGSRKGENDLQEVSLLKRRRGAVRSKSVASA